MCVCVCVRERERETEKDRERELNKSGRIYVKKGKRTKDSYLVLLTICFHYLFIYLFIYLLPTRFDYKICLHKKYFYYKKQRF